MELLFPVPDCLLKKPIVMYVGEGRQDSIIFKKKAKACNWDCYIVKWWPEPIVLFFPFFSPWWSVLVGLNIWVYVSRISPFIDEVLELSHCSFGERWIPRPVFWGGPWCPYGRIGQSVIQWCPLGGGFCEPCYGSRSSSGFLRALFILLKCGV